VIGQCEDAEVVIVDPPRRGLDEGVLQLLTGKHESASAPSLRRLIYVSCGFDAFDRDSKYGHALTSWLYIFQ
jgi:23S rRNA (uracil1939-C5)-methyltransferase